MTRGGRNLKSVPILRTAGTSFFCTRELKTKNLEDPVNAEVKRKFERRLRAAGASRKTAVAVASSAPSWMRWLPATLALILWRARK